MDLALLIDDSLGGSFGTQISDLKEFVRGLPPGTRVAVVYSTHGNANFIQKFTTDHQRAAASIRLPIGNFNEVSSIYMALNDLIKHWPGHADRRAVLLLSSGLDLYRGFTESEATQNPDLDEAIESAQHDNVNVFSIFARQAGGLGRNMFLLNNGQSCLSYLAQATGGKAFFEGFHTPVDMQPMLKKVDQLLRNQYLLTFNAQTEPKASYDRLKVTTVQPGVNLITPDEVYVPAAGNSTSASQ